MMLYGFFKCLYTMLDDITEDGGNTKEKLANFSFFYIKDRFSR
jgi:hypothetical protein